MLTLKLVNFLDIQHWMVDFQKRSKNYEIPPEETEFWGIFRNTELIGYFATISYTGGIVEINQGYLKPEARHRSYNRIALGLLETLVKKAGYKEIVLGTNRAVNSYQKFMKDCGFELTRAIFKKRLN